jgi:hypothetical protein
MTPYEARTIVARRIASDTVTDQARHDERRADFDAYDWLAIQLLAMRFVSPPDPDEYREAWELLAGRAEVGA